MNTASLEWFGPLERNTLRPLCVVLTESGCDLESSRACAESSLYMCVPERPFESLCVLAGVLSLLYVQGEHVH